MILLDEPMAGVSAEDVHELVELIRSVHAEEGKTVLMVEHHMEVVTGLAERIAVMHHGALLAVRHAGGGDGEPDRPVGVPRGGAVMRRGRRDAPLLEVEHLHVHLGQSHVLQGVSFEVPEGGVTALLGRNGVGKTTTLRAIIGLVGRARHASARRRGLTSAADAPRSCAAASATCPEDRDVFAGLTVEENLRLAERDGRAALRPRLRPLPGAASSAARSGPGRSPAASSRWSRSPARC